MNQGGDTGQATVGWLSNEHNDGATYSDPSYVEQQVTMETSEQAPLHEEQSNMNHHPLYLSSTASLQFLNQLYVLCISTILKMYVCTHAQIILFCAFDIFIVFSNNCIDSFKHTTAIA